MDDSELRGLIASKIQNAIGYQGGRLSQERQLADRYYQGSPFGNELPGRSQVVSRDVAEAVDGMMPSLMKIFTSGDEIVKFEPTGPEDEEVAKQATDYVNWIFMKQNTGFSIMFDWFKTALLKKNGLLKIWWDKREINKKETYEGLDDWAFRKLMDDPDLELVEHDEYPDPDWVPPEPMPPQGQPVPMGGMAPTAARLRGNV